MQLSIYGKSDKQLLDSIAKNVYTMVPDEYRIIPNPDADGEFILDINTLRRFDTIVRANISNDRVKATISLFPPINSPVELDIDMLMKALKERYQISETFTDRAMLEKHLPVLRGGLIVLDIPAVEGVPVVHGKNAIVQYFFEMPNTKPKILPNGRVDYKEFNNFVYVNKGDLIVKKTPPTAGSKGVDVTGADINPISGADKVISVVEGVEVNETNTEYRAKHSGHIIKIGDSLSVLPMLAVNGDIDLKVGNVHFDGAVQVSRNVLPGFTIDAEDIVIEGIDEDAILIAKNNIVIKTGIKGLGNKGYIKAGGDVVAGYSENAQISAAGCVEIKKYCFNSDISADRVFTSGSDSLVTGGVIRAFSEIRLANAGSKGNNDMTLAVGISPLLDDKAAKVQEEIDNLNGSLEKIMLILSKLDLKNPAVLTNPKVRKLLETVSILKRKLPLLRSKHTDLKSKSMHPSPKIIIERFARAGVKVKFYDVQIELKVDMSKVEFFFVNETREISFKPFSGG